MHRKRIVHRDLKPENIVFSSLDNPCVPEVIKIIDFGMATQFQVENKSNLKKRVGTVLNIFYAHINVYIIKIIAVLHCSGNGHEIVYRKIRSVGCGCHAILYYNWH